MRSFRTFALVLVIVAMAGSLSAQAAALSNPDFETGTLAGWTTAANQMTIQTITNNTFNRNYAASITGKYASASWITNSISQTIQTVPGDDLVALGFVAWPTQTLGSGSATGRLEASLFGPFGTNTKVWTAPFTGWDFFELEGGLFGVKDSGFESGSFGSWQAVCDDLASTIVTQPVYAGNFGLRMEGVWTGWSFNEVRQMVYLQSGDVVQASARMKIAEFSKTLGGAWAVAGIKLELNNADFESVLNVGVTNATWTNLSFSAVITNTGTYTYRCMICGDGLTGFVDSDVYFDDVTMTKSGGGFTGSVADVTVALKYTGYSGGAATTNSATILYDSMMLKGSSANSESPGDVYTRLYNKALTAGTNAGQNLPAVAYAPLETFGNGPDTNALYPSYVEVSAAGWKFRGLGSNTIATATNKIEMTLRQDGAFLELDQYRYLGVNANQPRGTAAVVLTNTPYFSLGTDNNSSAEFGNGPFPEYHRYVVGTSLTNFPRRLCSTPGLGWPRVLFVVFDENFSTFSNSLYNKHFVVDTVTTNGASVLYPIIKAGLTVSQDGLSNQVDILSQDVHMGSATKEQSQGKVDYPNITYQDHNEVALRAPWLYNLADDGTGWYAQQSPRGSATIEPLELNFWDAGSWVLRPYEEALFTWSHAASGVRSFLDADKDDRLTGRASYHVGYKVGHAYGTNAYGGIEYPEVVNVRGCGYFRMADYGGVMAGSFRPVAADVFSIFSGAEDAPLIPEAYVRVVPRTTPVGQPDNSYGQAYMSFQSKTNQALVGALKTDLHFSPEEVVNSGAYIDFNVDTWAHKAVDPNVDGPLACFAQVSMHWRGLPTINNGQEGHDIDAVIVKKTDGEWVTHQVLNPKESTYHRTLSTFRSNDVVYLMQQDRGKDSYGFNTESPYNRACAFEMTMLDDGGHNISMDVYESRTVNELADNVDIVANINESIAQGGHVNYKYRYRTIYAPGVYITQPNDPSGGEGWGNRTYKIKAYAVEGGGKQLQANFYYGNGKDDDWTLINAGGPVTIAYGGSDVEYDWDISGVPAGAYYIKVTAQPVTGGKIGFDISNTRLQVGDKSGFAHNGGAGSMISTNPVLLGNNLGFESGNLNYWFPGADNLTIAASSVRAYEGTWSARMSGNWAGWSWNSLVQEVPCVSGEVLHVTGRVFINALVPGSTNAVLCGIKMENTNLVPILAGTDISYSQAAATGVWHSVDFYRNMVQNGTERLLLYTCGNDCSSADVFFDGLQIASSRGIVSTNPVIPGYWGSTNYVSVTNQDALSFWISATTDVSNLRVWVADSSSVTSSVPVTNFISRIFGVAQRVDIAWTNFTGINKASLRGIGFMPSSTESNAVISKLQSHDIPFLVVSQIANPPATDGDGLPLYVPGQVVTNVITIQNLSGSAVSGIKVQSVQEYADDQYWTDSAPPGAFDCIYTRRGDRLCGTFEQVWSNQSISAGASKTLTNVYVVPYGLFKEAWSNFQYAFRNYESRAKAHVTLRDSTSDSLFADDEIGLYRMDDAAPTDNHSPTLNMAPYYLFPVGYGTNYSWYPYDPDRTWGATGIATYVQGPAGALCTTDNNTTVTLAWTPGVGDVGTTSLVKFIVNDCDNATNSIVTNTTLAICPTDWDNDGWNDGWEWTTYGTLWNSPTNINNPPVASNQTVNTTEDTVAAITLQGGDADTNALTYILFSSPTNGTLTGTPPSLSYRPATNWNGTDSFKFRCYDGIQYGNTATVTIAVSTVNDAPRAFDKRVSVTMNVPKAIALTAVDPDSPTLTYLVGSPLHGQLTGAAPDLTYTPSNNYTGSDSFTFRAHDGSLTSGVATVSLTISASNMVNGYERNLNCGGGPYTALDGTFYERDLKYSAIHGAGYMAGGQATTEGAFGNTDDDYVFTTERYGVTEYRFDLPSGTYTVQLSFAETYLTAEGLRKFNVYIEGVQVLNQLDIYSNAGPFSALTYTFTNAVADRQLNIVFSNVVDWASIRAISVRGGGNAAGVTTPGTLTATGLPFRTRLSWGACPDADLWGYHVERADAATGTFVRISPSLIVATNFSDVQVNNNRTYYYRVYAVDYSGNQSAPNAAVSATPRQVAMTRPFPAIPACAWRHPLGAVPGETYERTTPDKGIPLGGIGAGSFMYSISGSFGPWALDQEQAAWEKSWLWEAAFHVYEKPVSGVSTTLCLSTRGDTNSPIMWPRIGVSNATYYALHPRGWITYDQKFLNPISVQFFSPVMPNNYKESSYPVAVFDWTVTNTQAQSVDMAIMLTWPNKSYPQKTRVGWTNHPVTIAGSLKGMVLKATAAENTPETQNSEWCIATRDATNVVFSYIKSWDATNTGSDVWNDFSADGQLSNGSYGNSDQSAAIAVKVTLAAGEVRTIPFIIAWDFPVSEFVGGAQWWKKYCEFFGTDSDNSPDIAAEALRQYTNWEQQISAWQQPFVTNNLLPDWLKCAAFNELYYNQFGGIFWESGLKYHPTKPTEYYGLHVEDSKHFEQECFEYENSSPVDVRHYSSLVYAKMWPQIERDFLVNVADTITYLDPVLHQTPHNMGSTRSPYGDPGDPFFTIDCYRTYEMHWKDLPSRYIQQAWRYDYLHNDPAFLDYVWPSMKQTYGYLKTRDLDADGLPDHLGNGVPDNTYDNWGGGLKGASAICGGLWVGALEAMEQLAIKQGDPILPDVQAWLANARTNLETKLWFEAGGYYRSDSGSDNPKRDSIMADALSGDRYGESFGLAAIADTNHMRSMLEQVYDRCVVPLPDVTGDGIGDVGAINGLYENSELFDASCQQPNEVWCGTTYMLAAMMHRFGLRNEALQSAFGIYERCYENDTTALWFNTPEGWLPNGTWMRPRNPEGYQRVRAIWELVQELTPGLMTYTSPAPSAADANLALGCSVTASSVDGAYAAANAVDGSWSSRWSSAWSDPQWIAIDLGTPTDLSRVMLHWETAYGSAYRLQGSTDNTNWADLAVVTNGNGSTDMISFTNSPRARYVRMYGEQRGTGWGYSLWEFEVYGKNLAQNKSTTSSSANTNAPANMARDGRADTGWSSVVGDAPWLKIDLGALSQLDSLNLIWGAAYASNYTVACSTDGSNWTNVFSTTSGNGGTDRIALASPVNTRYVRLTIVGTAGYTVQELQVFGGVAIVNNAPNAPSSPTPANGASNQSINVDLAWTGGDPDAGDTVTNDVYFGLALPRVVLAAGGTHSMLGVSNGTGKASAWGLNNNGQLGDGSTSNRILAISVSNLTGVVGLSGGALHSLALNSNGTAYAWGYNGYGQLGDRSATARTQPVLVSNLVGITRVAAGYYHSLAVRTNGTVWAWGYNNYGQLGVGNQKNTNMPMQVSNLVSVADVAGGMYHSMALATDGTVRAWGYNVYGQLGDRSASNRYQPVLVSNLTGVASVNAGYHHSLAVKTNGTVWAWGYNNYGQLGIRSAANTNVPTQVSNLVSVVRVVAGYYHSLALNADGTVWAWGYNNYGQLGRGNTSNTNMPAPVSNLVDVVAIACGSYHSVAVKADGSVWAWGYNSNGQLGDGTTNNRSLPTRVSNVVATVTAGQLTLASDNQPGTMFDPGTMFAGTRYSWQVIATDNHGLSSTGAVWSFRTMWPAQAPTYSPDGGTYTNSRVVVLSSATPGSRIYYATNGTPPTTNSPWVNTGSSITLYGSYSNRVLSFATATGYIDSVISTSVLFRVLPPPPAGVPTYNPNGGTYTGSVNVTLSSTTTGSRIYYATNGTGPTTNSPWVNTGGAITLSASFSNTVRAFTTATGYLNSAISTSVLFIVKPSNTAPVASNQTVSTAEDTAKAITLTGGDAETTNLTYAIASNPSAGQLTGTPPNVTYTPNTNYNGADSFTFRVADGLLTSSVATVSITVTAVNDAPTANPQSITMVEDATTNFTLTGSDPETNALTCEVVTFPAYGSLWGTLPNVTYGPNVNFNGADSFTFRVSDVSLTSALATVSFTVTGVNDAPSADSQTVYTAINTARAITLTATDPETNSVTLSIVSNPSHGSLSGTPPSVTYTPSSSYFGDDSFTFRATDGMATGAAGTVSIVVTANVKYVDASNSSGTEDGSEAYPFNTIGEGVTAAGNQSIVLVAAGNYVEQVNVYYLTNITISGEGSGTIVSNATSPKFYVLSSAQVMIEDLCIRGGEEGLWVSSSSNVTIRSSTIEELSQYSYSSYAALQVSSSPSFKAESNLFKNCYGGQYGGGGWIGYSDAEFLDNRFINLTAWNSAGGFYVFNNNATTTVRFARNYFKSCSADYSGALLIGGQNMIVNADHNLFEGCGSDYVGGGTIQVTGDPTLTLNLINNVIADVYVPCCGSVMGVYAPNYGTISSRNNIFYNMYYGIYAATTTVSTAEYSDMYLVTVPYTGVTLGSGNISANPLFTDKPNTNYYLMTNSPCINAGNPAASYNDADGSRNDMGMYGGGF